ncbi:MAG: hypothetical protein KDA84_25200 [Planctomycetaceae bacterium]|nr:hypothetical protein [Planctomycetaceae bacterium]
MFLDPEEDEDGLGFCFHWKGQIPALTLTNWGRGDGKLGSALLPVEFALDSRNPPSASQQSAFEWFCAHLDETLPRIQKACERSWKECYYWEGNEMTEDDGYFIEGIRIPPNNASEWTMNPRDPSLPALIIVDLKQDWEVEHGFYVVLDPVRESGDCWTTWDGLSDMGLVYEEEDD